MRTSTNADEPATQFRMNPAGPFTLRDYSGDDPADLRVLRDLLEEILTQHKMLIPGQLNRFVVQWHADLQRAIDAKPAKAPRS
jgi:hypothetical protein